MEKTVKYLGCRPRCLRAATRLTVTVVLPAPEKPTMQTTGGVFFEFISNGEFSN
jgi:hypothetical protein